MYAVQFKLETYLNWVFHLLDLNLICMHVMIQLSISKIENKDGHGASIFAINLHIERG